jgi:hypothetical protein
MVYFTFNSTNWYILSLQNSDTPEGLPGGKAVFLYSLGNFPLVPLFPTMLPCFLNLHISLFLYYNFLALYPCSLETPAPGDRSQPRHYTIQPWPYKRMLKIIIYSHRNNVCHVYAHRNNVCMCKTVH